MQNLLIQMIIRKRIIERFDNNGLLRSLLNIMDIMRSNLYDVKNGAVIQNVALNHYEHS